MQIVIYLIVGLVAGVASGLFGIGGGLIIVPSLAFFAGFSLHSALGTSLGALLLPVGLLGVLEYHRSGHVDIKVSLLIALGIFIGTYLGAKIVQPLSPLILKRLYGAFLLVMGFRLIIGK